MSVKPNKENIDRVSFTDTEIRATIPQSIIDRALCDDLYQIIFELDRQRAIEQLKIDMLELYR
jgi:hypothetical protein